MSKNEGWMGKQMYSEGWGVDYSNEMLSTFIWFIALGSGIFPNMNWFWETNKKESLFNFPFIKQRWKMGKMRT